LQAARGEWALAFHKKDDPKMTELHLHTLLPLRAINTYAQAFATANVEIIPYPGLRFSEPLEAEAAAMTWLDLAAIGGEGSAHFVVDLTWRHETIREFLAAGPNASTKSALAKLDVFNEEEDEWDTLKFRLMLWPTDQSSASELETERGAAAATPPPPPAAPAMPSTPPTAMDVDTDLTPPAGDGLASHRIVLQLVGGKNCSQVYMLSFHTIDPTYQVHVAVPDHRIPIYQSRETFHRYHPLMSCLQSKARIRVLVRAKPDGSGPLGDMCGCC